MTLTRIIGLFILAAIAEIGGAWLIWQEVREHCSWWLAAGSLAWGVVLDGFKPTRWDIIGAVICLIRVGVIMLVPKH